MHGLYFKGGGRVSEGKVLRPYSWYENKGQIYNLILLFLFAQDFSKGMQRPIRVLGFQGVCLLTI